jgi:hypothetical protein
VSLEATATRLSGPVHKVADVEVEPAGILAAARS